MMYPAHGLALFPPFPRDQRVFVAMAFDARLQSRWQNVIAPGITDAHLSPFRVDIPQASNSIPTEIIRGIAASRLVLGDVTRLDGHPNGNVMYELGIAHASRQPEEVLIFRSDRERLLFDVSTIRVHSYDPDGQPDQARALTTGALLAALREIDTVRAALVEQTANSLDVPSIEMLIQFVGEGKGMHPTLTTMGQILAAGHQVQAIARLLELGLIAASSSELSSDEQAGLPTRLIVDFVRSHTTYRPTPFGQAVMMRLARRWKMPTTGSE